MSGYRSPAILDTDVASYTLKAVPIGWDYRELIAPYEAYIAFVTAAQLLCGAERRDWGSRRRLELDIFLAGCPVIPFRVGMERLFARLMIERERAGRRLEESDAWIATTAIFHEIPLVTHDGDFIGTPGLRIITASDAHTARRLQ